MRHQYLYLDPELIQAILAGLDLLRMFNQLVLASGGAFEEIFQRLNRSGPGYHPIQTAGEGIERLPETRPYKFGDDIHLLDSARSLQNAMRRTHGDLELAEDDLEVF